MLNVGFFPTTLPQCFLYFFTFFLFIFSLKSNIINIYSILDS